jgi:hypothetical protein
MESEPPLSGVASRSSTRGHISLLVTVTGLVFVGPWWRLWRRLRFVFWSLIVLYLALFSAFGVSLIAVEALHWLFGETFGPPLRWLRYWGGD